MQESTDQVVAPIAAVIAGTLIDTALGVTYLNRLGFDCLSYAAGRDPKEQSFLQNNHPDLLQQACLRNAQDMARAGAKFVLIYCNSLSASLNLDEFKAQLPIPVVTPMDVYQSIAMCFQRFAIVAANAVGLLGADAAIRRRNPRAVTFGYHDIEIVRRIEQQCPAATIIKDSGLVDFLSMAKEQNVDLVLLACTHYPYLTPEIQALCAMPVMDIDMGLRRCIEAALRPTPNRISLEHDFAN